MKRPPLSKLIAAAAGLYLLGLAGVLLLQPRLLYFPGEAPPPPPSLTGCTCEEVRFQTEDGETLSAWFLSVADPLGAVIFSHGNAGNIAGRLGAGRALAEMGFSVLLYDYRGFGASSGSPDEEGTYLDAEAAHRWLVEEGGFAPSKVVAYGRSLGGGVATELALRQPVAGVFLESTFTSIPDMASEVYPWIPLRWFPCIEYDNLTKVLALEVPLAVAHSPDDQLIPLQMGEALAKAAPTTVEWIEGSGGHNSPGVLMRPGTRDRVARFLRTVVEDPAALSAPR